MAQYLVKLIKTSSVSFEVKAKNEEEAEKKAFKMAEENKEPHLIHEDEYIFDEIKKI